MQYMYSFGANYTGFAKTVIHIVVVILMFHYTVHCMIKVAVMHWHVPQTATRWYYIMQSLLCMCFKTACAKKEEPKAKFNSEAQICSRRELQLCAKLLQSLWNIFSPYIVIVATYKFAQKSVNGKQMFLRIVATIGF